VHFILRLTTEMENSFNIYCSINSNLVPFSLLLLWVKLNYQLRNPAVTNAEFPLRLAVPKPSNCQEFVVHDCLFVFPFHAAHKTCVRMSTQLFVVKKIDTM
jgi:hypothetical protein